MDSIENGKNTIQQKVFTSCESAVISKYKDAIIVVLTIFIILTILGINTCEFISRGFYFIYEIIGPIFYNVLKLFGFGIGAAVNDSSNSIANAAKGGIDVLSGTVNDAGNVLIGVTDSDENDIKRLRRKGEKCDKTAENFANMSDETRINQSFDTTLNKSTMRQPLNIPEPSDVPKNNSFTDVTEFSRSSTLPLRLAPSEWCSVDENDGKRNCDLYTQYSA